MNNVEKAIGLHHWVTWGLLAIRPFFPHHFMLWNGFYIARQEFNLLPDSFTDVRDSQITELQARR